MSQENGNERETAVSTKKVAKKKKLKTAKKRLKGKAEAIGATAKFPRHSVEKALRIPRAIIEQNAGHACSDKDSATYVGVGFNGPYRVEISSSIKYGFLDRPSAGMISVTDRARQAIRPQKVGDDIEALRQAALICRRRSVVLGTAVDMHYERSAIRDFVPLH
ncbi:hypothetical protein [Bradyrhizobium cosmicum]|uniref:hypothetical protein n=1 Tax=Bradyrhizobium cosmicum TaxID=1404864 RepID=UPI0028E435C7|nr:hypothetical protein [Bradyrhizobium cosmicum]